MSDWMGACQTCHACRQRWGLVCSGWLGRAWRRAPAWVRPCQVARRIVSERWRGIGGEREGRLSDCEDWVQPIPAMHEMGLDRLQEDAGRKLAVDLESSAVSYMKASLHSPHDLLAHATCAGYKRLANQINCLHSVHVVLRSAADLKLSIHSEMSVEPRKVTESLVEKVLAAEQSNDLLREFQGAQDLRGWFAKAPQPSNDASHLAVLDGLCDPDALVAESLRQAARTVDDVVGLWVEDTGKLAVVVQDMCPGGWEPTEKLLEPESEQHRTSLLNNPHYAKLGPAVEVLCQATRLLERLHTEMKRKVAAAGVLQEFAVVGERGSLTVVTTYCLWLLYQQFPLCKDSEAKKAHVDKLVAQTKGRTPIPAALWEALCAALQEPVSK